MSDEQLSKLEVLLNSEEGESRELGSLLLLSEEIPEEDRIKAVKVAISKYLDGEELSEEAIKNIIEAYNKTNKLDMKNRVKKI